EETQVGFYLHALDNCHYLVLDVHSLMTVLPCALRFLIFFFFNNTPTTEIYTLSLHDALPIYSKTNQGSAQSAARLVAPGPFWNRSEEHTSELQSRRALVCRLLLETKMKSFAVVTPASRRPVAHRSNGRSPLSAGESSSTSQRV